MPTETTAGSSPPDGTSPDSRRRLPIVPVLVLLTIVGGLVFLFTFRSRPEEQVRRLIDRQIKLAGSRQFGQLWSTLSQGARSACPSGTFTGALSTLPPEFWELIEYRDIHIDVEGDKALVTYVITYNGKPIEEATRKDPDVYVRATETVYGRAVSVDDQLASLDRQRDQALLAGPKDYEEKRKAILKRGPTRPRLFVAGQWYDDLDGHVRCA